MNLKHDFTRYVSLNVLGMLGISCYILADTFFISRGMGAAGLTALNLAIPVYNLMHGIGLMIGMGGATRFSLSKDRFSFSRALLLDIFFAAIFLTAAIFAKPLASLLGADSKTLSMTTSYLRVLLLFSPFFLLNNCLICFVRNDGAPNLSMLGMLLGSLSNIILDYVFVFPFGWGITGAAIATGIAPIISILILSTHFLKRKNGFSICPKSSSPKDFFDICALGSASFVNELASAIVMLVFNFLLLSTAGNLGVAAYGIIANIAIVMVSIFTGISQGISPLVSRLCGEGEKKSALTVLKAASWLSLIISVSIYTLSFIFTDQIVGIFNTDGGAVLSKMARSGLRIYFTSLLFSGINILFAAYHAASDRAAKSFAISISRGLLIIVPAAFLLSHFFGINGIWLSVTVTETVVFFISLLLLR